MQCRSIGQLCDIPFNTLYGLFARWTRLGLWRRLLDRLRRTWRRACGDTPEPSAVVDHLHRVVIRDGYLTISAPQSRGPLKLTVPSMSRRTGICAPSTSLYHIS